MVVVEDDGDIGDGERGGCCCRPCCLKLWRATTFTLLLFDHCESGVFFVKKCSRKQRGWLSRDNRVVLGVMVS